MSHAHQPVLLIVEDEPGIIELIKDTLIGEDYKIFEAMDGEKGLQIALAEKPDLVLLDIRLPKMDGYEVSRRIKSEPELTNTSVVLLTAYGQKQEIEEGFKAMADDYVIKPFEPSFLREHVRRFLQKN